MLITTEAVKTPSVERLLYLWAQRYKPDLSTLPMAGDASVYDSLLQTVSVEGRTLTATKLKDGLLDSNCQMAWIQAKSLYAYIPNILDLQEARRITQFAFRVYKKILEIYQQRSVSAAVDSQPANGINFQYNSLAAWGIPAIDQLAYALEPVLLVFQEQHVTSKDWRALGFMTSQLNFTNKLILRKLSPIERVLLKPYLKFVEEQVAIPWHRVCTAAAKYEMDSPEFVLVEQMLPLADEIGQCVYRRLTELLPDYRSQRGKLIDPEVTHSSTRDLNMFQAYLWLCVLKKNVAPIEQELLNLCVMVMESVHVPWELTEKWLQVLTEELLIRCTPAQQQILLPYTQVMEQVFIEQRHRLGFRDSTVAAI